MRAAQISWRADLVRSTARNAVVGALCAVPVVLLLPVPSLQIRALLGDLFIAALMFGVWRAPESSLRFRSLVLVAIPFVAALYFYSLAGFLAGPALLLAISMTLAAALLGHRAMLAVVVGSALGIGSMSYAFSVATLRAPAPEVVRLTAPYFWLRATAMFTILMFALGTTVSRIISRIEAAVAATEAEARRREEAERERADVQIAAAQASKLEAVGRLAAGVAHDFNNNLTAIMGSAELLAMDLPKSSPIHPLVADILEASERAADLTGQLLAYSRNSPAAQKPAKLNEIVHSALRLFRRANSAQVELQVELTDAPLVVSADVTQLQNACLNLLLNGRDALNAGGCISVRTSEVTLDPNHAALPPGRYAVLEVEDSGQGISPEVLPRIFEPFFTTKGPGRGTGLGLAAVQGTVRSHGGSIEAESTPGAGALFRVRLPLLSEGAAANPGREVPQRGGGKILVVEDDPAVRGTSAAALRSLGYDVTTVSGGAQALALVAAEPALFSLVLLDLHMPKLGGRDTLRELQMLAPTLPVLLCSGLGTDTDASAIRAAGASDIVQKPYRLADLSRQVASAIVSGSSARGA